VEILVIAAACRLFSRFRQSFFAQAGPTPQQIGSNKHAAGTEAVSLHGLQSSRTQMLRNGAGACRLRYLNVFTLAALASSSSRDCWDIGLVNKTGQATGRLDSSPRRKGLYSFSLT